MCKCNMHYKSKISDISIQHTEADSFEKARAKFWITADIK